MHRHGGWLTHGEQGRALSHQSQLTEYWRFVSSIANICRNHHSSITKEEKEEKEEEERIHLPVGFMQEFIAISKLSV